MDFVLFNLFLSIYIYTQLRGLTPTIIIVNHPTKKINNIRKLRDFSDFIYYAYYPQLIRNVILSFCCANQKNVIS